MTDTSESDATARGPEKSIKRRIARLILVPGVAALVLWLATSAYLVFNGYYDREVANGVRKVSIPAVSTLAAIQRERRESINYLSHAAKDLPQLIAQRQETDTLVEKLRTAAGSVLSRAPRRIDVRWQAFSDRLDRLPGIRSTIDSGRAGRLETTVFYDDLVDAAIDLFDTQARVVPDATATQGAITATDTFRAGDLMSRAGSVISSAFGSNGLNRQDHLQFVKMVGAYHATLDAAVPHLHPDARVQYDRIMAMPEWSSLSAAENTLIAAGPWKSRPPGELALDAQQWDTVTNAIADQLVALTVTQADRVSQDALDTGNNQLLAAALGSAVALLIAVGAIVSAVRQSQILVNRALSVRLAQLGQDAVTVVDERLPSIIEKLRRREKVDVALELPHRDYGRDEIGHLATVLNRSLRAAVDAAVEEATTRAAGMAMLMGVARRPQRPLQHGLKVIEELQNRIGDEKILGELFDINHQLTQTRRFLENLIILAGGQAGRRFPRPVPIRRVLLGAVAETRQYQRVTLRRAPEVAISGPAIAGITHLLAELLDNALVFSPPESEVWLSCTQAHNGVVIEIEDAGVGMTPEAMDRANTLLATAPVPDLSGLRGGAQIGLWVVAELAKRGNMQVTLRPSAYGGVLAVVLLPASALAPGEEPRPAATEPGDDHERSQPGAGRPPARRPATPVPALQQPTWPLPEISPAASPPAPATGSAVATARPPLPQRRPQEHLAHQLKEESGTPAQAAGPAHTPETARNRLAGYQHGWRAGRTGDITPPGHRSGSITPPGHRTGDVTPPGHRSGEIRPPAPAAGDDLPGHSE